MSNEIKQLILQHTGGPGDIMRPRGPCCGKARREILGAATGLKWSLVQACIDPRQTTKALGDAVAAWAKS